MKDFKVGQIIYVFSPEDDAVIKRRILIVDYAWLIVGEISTTPLTWSFTIDEVSITPEEAFNYARINFPNTQKKERQHLEYLLDVAELECIHAKERLADLDQATFPTEMQVID